MKLIVILVIVLHLIPRMKLMIVETVNRILCEVGISPVKSRTSKALREQSKSDVQRLLSKLHRGIQRFQGINRKTCDYLEFDYLL